MNSMTNVVPIFDENDRIIGLWTLQRDLVLSLGSLAELRSLAEPTLRALRSGPCTRTNNFGATRVGDNLCFQDGAFLMLTGEVPPPTAVRKGQSFIAVSCRGLPIARRAESCTARRSSWWKTALPTALIMMIPLFSTGCVATLKALNLATFNEVLIGVQKSDANKVREAAREGVVFDDGQKAIDSSNICGERPLHLAIQKNNLEIVNILLQEGADPDLPSELPREPSMCESLNILDTPAGFPALHYAIWDNKPDIAESLLFAGADPATSTSDGKNALQLAADKTGFERVEAYLHSPAHLAARTGDIATLRSSVAAGTQATAILSFNGRSLLDEALLSRHYFVVDYLLAQGGTRSGLGSTEVAEAVDEYLLQNPDSPYDEALRQLTDDF